MILLSTGLTWYSALLLNFISALSGVIGFFVGVAIGTGSEKVNGWILAFAAGLFIYIALVDLVSRGQSSLFPLSHTPYLPPATSLPLSLSLSLTLPLPPSLPLPHFPSLSHTLPPSLQLPELIHSKEKGRHRWGLFIAANAGFFVSFLALFLLAVYEEDLNTLI